MAAVIGLMPAPVAAADDSTQVLIGETAAAITVDVDGDGVREVVRVVVDPTRPHRFLLEAWAFDGERWSMVGSTDVTRHNAGRDARVPINTSADAFGLLAWNDGNGERLLVATVSNAAGRVSGCCLTISAVTMSDGALRAFPLVGTFGDAEMLTVLDTDGDGIDELLVTEQRDTAAVRLLRWNGESGFDSQRLELAGDPSGIFGWVIGDSDGVSGEEVIIGATQDGQLMRLRAGPDGALMVERAFGVPGSLGRAAWPFGAADGLLMGAGFDGIQVMRWPRGGEIDMVHRLRAPERVALSVVGTGDDAVIVDYSRGAISDQLPQDVLVYDLSLEQLLEVPASEAAGRLIELAEREFPALRLVPHHIHPYVGPLPGGLGGGREAFFSAGSMVVLGTDGELAQRSTSGLVGRLPVGVAGPDDGWMALAEGFPGFRDVAYLFPTGLGGSLSVAPLAEVLPDERPDGHLRPELHDAVLIEGPDGKQRLVAPDGGFTATIRAPLRSLVVVAMDHSILFQGEMGVEPMSIDIAPDEDEGNQDFEVAIVVITPAGAASSVAWDGEILREPPGLTAGAETNLFELSATVSGRATPESAVTVDGAPVATDARGAFTLPVDAAIWPREVLVIASDPVGNETVERISVVGLVDYRGLPWVALVAAATIGIGIALFARTPRHRAESPGHADDARLEEIQ